MDELHPVLLHDDRVRALAELHEALVGRVPELLEIACRLVGRQVGVPFGVDDQRRARSKPPLLSRFLFLQRIEDSKETTRPIDVRRIVGRKRLVRH